MTDPREVLSRALGGIPISPDVNMEEMTRELNRAVNAALREKDRAERDARDAARTREVRSRHNSIAQHLTGTLREVFDHHAPRGPRPEYMPDWYPYCRGCDQATDATTDWPCSTWELIERAEKQRKKDDRAND